MLYRIGRQKIAADVRALGRLAFVDNYKAIARRLEIELETCCSAPAMEKAVRETGLQFWASAPRVYIVTSLADGTGSGMFLDLAFLVRHKLQELGFDNANVIGLCYLPPTAKDPRRTGELANTFAALTELNFYNGKKSVFSAQYELGEIRAGGKWFTWEGPPLPRCLFFTLPEGQDATLNDGVEGGLGISAGLAKTLAKAGRVIFSELTTPLGRTTADSHASRVPLYQTAGMHRLVWPRRQLLEHAARRVCQRLVQRWASKNAKAMVEPVKQWIGERWNRDGFPADQLIGRYQEACEAALGRSPESVFLTIHAGVANALTPAGRKQEDCKPNLAAVVDAMEQLEQIVGVPEECRPPCGNGEPQDYQPGSVETLLEAVAAKVVEQFEQKLAEFAVCMIEDPHYRLAGAEEALRQLRGLVERALQAHEQLASELEQRAVAIYERIHALLDNPGHGTQATTWKPPFSRRNAGGPGQGVTELVELLRTYPKCRYQAIIMQRITVLYVSLRGLLSDQLREVDYCRARLADLAAIFCDTGHGPYSRLEAPAAGRYLSAQGCKSVEQAIEQLQSKVGDSELVDLDARIQGLIRIQFKALVHICMASANMLKSVAPAMHKETRAFLRSRLVETNVAEIYQGQFQSDSQDADTRLEDDLAEAFEMASPDVTASPPLSELNLLAVPPGPGEERLREVAAKAIGSKEVTPTQSADEITIYREHTLTCLADLDQLGPAALEAYHKAFAHGNGPHSRFDIAEWGTRSGESSE
jgi:eukaryotic-like serine/threonine-protein kinase